MLVDDERLARQALRRALATFPGVEVVGEADGVAAAGEALDREKPDGIFLDVQMPGADGFQLLEGRREGPKVVFVTAHAEHAVRAFAVEAVDYLLKPVRVARLGLAIERLKSALAVGGEWPVDYGVSDRICLRMPGRTVVTAVDRIVALRAEGDYTRVFVAGEAPLMVGLVLGRYERALPAERFVRVDRSLIVNRGAVARWRRVSRDEGLLWLTGMAEPVRLGRAAQGRLRAALAADGRAGSAS